ncbi:MAG TPA: FHA domain-containing serine/threonine-protein kinase [Candidatus Brocadiia bacterium]|nr:FHA domain-containing serine/threonine-protein kinase [Candidatus Brocadiia bacterium]
MSGLPRSEEEQRIAELATRRSYVTLIQLQQCMAELKSLRDKGEDKGLLDFMKEKGLITAMQAQVLERQVENQGRFPILGGFEILMKLGEGGMGSVYKARQLSLDRIVAVKVLPRKLAADQEFLGRFLSEGRAAAKLNHPNIVQCYEAGEAEGRFFMAMEYVPGCNVADLIKERHKLDQLETMGIGLQMAQALQHAWEHQIVHRDVKPANILYSPDKMTKGNLAGVCGPAKLADLGLARAIDREEAHITGTGRAIGTPHYISPEMARGKSDPDPRCDVYSFGASLYHMLAGRTPYDGATPASIMVQHLTAPVPDPRRFAPETSPEFCAVVMKCMAKSPDERQQDHAEVAEEIEQCIYRQRRPETASVIMAEIIEEHPAQDPSEESGPIMAEVVDDESATVGLPDAAEQRPTLFYEEEEPAGGDAEQDDGGEQPREDDDAPHEEDDAIEDAKVAVPPFHSESRPTNLMQRLRKDKAGAIPPGSSGTRPPGAGVRSPLDRPREPIGRTAPPAVKGREESNRPVAKNQQSDPAGKAFGGVIDPSIIASSHEFGAQELRPERPLRLREGQSITIGRDSRHADIAIKDSRASRKHCEVTRKGGSAVVADLGSRNGTILNGEKVVGAVPAKEGDLVVIGRTPFRICFI